MSQIPQWRAKLDEAEFFFGLMHRHFNDYEFQYFVSAFLSALKSSVEHNRLQSKDPKFKEWYRQITPKLTSDGAWQLLSELRNAEVHKRGTEAWQSIGFSFPGGAEVRELEVDFSSGAPVGRYKLADSADYVQYQVEQRWVWSTPGEPDVLATCAKGLELVRKIIKSRGEMLFSE